MTLIKSISGIRGTIGGYPKNNLTPVDIVKYSAAFGELLKLQFTDYDNIKVVVGRDARISGSMLDKLVCGTLVGLGIDIINLGLATTPTTEIAVKNENAKGGIILTASHNTKEWNALKFLNFKGEIILPETGEKILQIAENGAFNFSSIDKLGKINYVKDYENIHIKQILQLDVVDVELVKKAGFKVVIDAVNSVGGIVVPKLLEALGVRNIIKLNCNPNGDFSHNPEPLPRNLKDISQKIIEQNADIGFAVDPDVDRLAIINEDGSHFGEEYTLVAIADYILSKQKGNTVSNLSSTRALRDITFKHGGEYFAAAVGEVNVVSKMKLVGAVIGGEGNGGVIYPKLHYGRDALLGIALFLTFLAKLKIKCSELRKSYPSYFMSKKKLLLTKNVDINYIFKKISDKYKKENINTSDGLKIDFIDKWVHIRQSNTEPVLRIYTECRNEIEADNLANSIIRQIKKLL